MGEDNAKVLSGLLGRTEEELSALETQGVVGYAPASPQPVQRPPMDQQVRQGRLLRYDADCREQVARAYLPPSTPHQRSAVSYQLSAIC